MIIINYDNVTNNHVTLKKQTVCVFLCVFFPTLFSVHVFFPSNIDSLLIIDANNRKKRLNTRD